MISCVARVEIKGCILKYAEKNPAIALNITQKRIERMIAVAILLPTDIVVKFQGPRPKSFTMFSPGCKRSPVITEPSATMRPTLKSVPARRMSPATPRA